MNYIFNASAVLFIFYACYQLFLQNETYFQANRWFLLSGLIVACVIPLVVIPVYIEYRVANTNNFINNYDNLITQVIAEEPFDYMQLIIWTYFAGILFFFGKLIVDFLSLRKVLKSSKSKLINSFKLLETSQNITPFSFFDCIVYNPEQFENEELQHIINHEKVHVQQWHSIDSIVSQLACILFWFNPIVWLYKKALQQNLEFIADQKAQHVSLCEKSYQNVLLKTSLQNHQLTITNNFHTSLIKKRIVMLHKSKSNKLNLFKLTSVLPLLAFFMMSFNTETVYVEIPIEEVPTMKLFQTEDIEQIFTNDMSDDDLVIIKKKLENQGVTFDYSAIKRNKKGEITAIKTEFKYNGNSGTYNISSDKAMEPFILKSNEDSFVVGNFTDRIPKTYTTHNGKTKVQSTGSSNSRVIETDTVFFTKQGSHLIKERDSIFINRNSKNQTWISKGDTKANLNTSENGNTNVFVSKSDEPLIIIDGKIAKKSALKNLDTNNINSMNVLKDKSAIKSYGEKGKNGVIIIKTKVFSDAFKKRAIKDSKVIIEHDDNTKNPLYIINDNIVSSTEFKLVNPDNIKSMNVIKGENAIELYGDKGKNGVIIIKTKTANYSFDKDKRLIVEVEDASPWQIKTAVSIVKYEDDNGEVSLELIISKNSTDAFLEKQKRELQKHGIEAKFSKVKRNKVGEITSIKISLDDNNGRKSSSSWKEKEQAIPDIVMGISNNALFVRAIDN